MGVITDLDKGNTPHLSRNSARRSAKSTWWSGSTSKHNSWRDSKKNQQGQVTRVQDFVMPSFTLKNKQVEVISDVSTSSSDLFSQLSFIMDQKIADIYKPMNDLKGQLDIMKKKGKSVDDNCAFQIISSSATPASAQEASYAMPMNYYKGQTLPPWASQPNMAGPVGTCPTDWCIGGQPSNIYTEHVYSLLGNP